jgi:dihydrofolate synthase/folylpolyglutamate synthase
MYARVINYLFNLRRFGMRLGLQNITELLEKLGNPHEGLKYIHIGGTKGKGSVCAFVSSILRSAGYKVGMYISPHLVDYTERIQVNGQQISKTDVVRLFNKIIPIVNEMANQDKKITFFEFTTALAFLYFKEQNIDFCVLEVGLGGRLDATNVVTPEVVVITNIDFEHTHILGHTKKSIAREKAGIIKKGCICITAETDIEPLDVIRKVCNEKGVPLYTTKDYVDFRLTNSTSEYQEILIDNMKSKIKLLGRHQIVNAATAVSVIKALRTRDVKIPETAITSGLENTVLPGRLDKVRSNVILDCAHTVTSARMVREYISSLGKNVIVILGISKDKNINGIVQEFAKISTKMIITKPEPTRSCDPMHIAVEAKKFNVDTIIKPTMGSAIQYSLETANPHDIILITGSAYTVGAALKYFRNVKNHRVLSDVIDVPTKIDTIYQKLKVYNTDDLQKNPFKVLIQTILSQRTRDVNTTIASEQLFNVYKTPYQLSTADIKTIEKLIKPVGFYKVKSTKIKEVARIIHEKYNDRVPDDINELMRLPGVGRKTANCVLAYGFGIPAIPVDTHVHRISNRLGIVATDTPEDTEIQLQKIVPRKYWIPLNHMFVRFGQTICKPIKPLCDKCPVNDLCQGEI